MRSSSKWLTGFGAAIGTLVIIAIVLVLALPGSGEIELPPEDTPEGVVMRYFQALKNEEYKTAYGYLSEVELLKSSSSTTLDMWVDTYADRLERAWKVTVIDSNSLPSYATVEINMEVFGPYVSVYDSVRIRTETYTLVRIDEKWKITDPVYIPWFLIY